MTQFTGADALRDYLANLLAAELGQFDNGIPRIWITPPRPPAGSEESLECLIMRTPRSTVSGSSGRQKKDLRRWEVSLVNYADDLTLHNALEKLKASDRLVFDGVPLYTPASTQNFESVRLSFFDPIMLTTTS